VSLIDTLAVHGTRYGLIIWSVNLPALLRAKSSVAILHNLKENINIRLNKQNIPWLLIF
jgi:hypothetical protein